MAQNIYDNPNFFNGYAQLPRQVLGLDGAPEWPATKAMFLPIAGKKAVDLGAGFGWVCRWLREQGASSVLGIDLSQKMIDKAQEKTNDSAITYQKADLETLQLPAKSFDFAFSSLTFHYIQDFDRLVQNIHQALTPQGQLVFTIEHPIFMAAKYPEWIQDRDGNKTWPVNGYSIEGKRETNWFVQGVVKYHRKMSTILNSLIQAGFEILEVQEFAPTLEQIAKHPALLEELERPMMLLVSARRK